MAEWVCWEYCFRLERVNICREEGGVKREHRKICDLVQQ